MKKTIIENKVYVENGKAKFLLNETTSQNGYVPIEEGIRMAIEIAKGIMEGR